MTAGYYARLQAALAGMAGLSDAEAAAALAAQTVAVVGDVQTEDARGLVFTTSEWSAIAIGAARARAGTATDPASVLCITVEDSFRLSRVLETSKPPVWESIQQMAAVLQGAGIISADTAAKLLALRSTARPVWDPLPTAQDVAHARALGA